MRNTNLYYQYTDLIAFKNIVENKELWATQVHYLNDFREYNPLNELIEKFIEDKQLLHPDSVVPIHFSEFIRELWFNQRTVIPYVISFSSHKDQLSQWRAYAEDGTGVSIGFRFEQKLVESHIDLEDFFSSCSPGEDYIEGKYESWILIKIKYLTTEWISVINRYLQEIYAHFEIEVFHEDKHPNHYKVNFQKYANPLWVASIWTKSKGFLEEEEFRLVYFARVNICHSEKYPKPFYENLEFRVGKRGLTPYIKIPFENYLNMKEVILGPMYKGYLRDVEDFLYKHGYDFENEDMDVSKSIIPYL